MFSILDMNGRRTVQSANYNSHNAGEKHPDRVMQLHDILCILDGAWELCQDGCCHILNKGDVIFLHAGRHHWGGDYGPGVKTLYIHLEPSPGDLLVKSEADAITPQGSLAVPVVVRAGEHASFIPLFEKITFAFWSDAPNKTIRMSSLIDQLLFQLAESNPAATPVYDSMIENALYMIHITPERFIPLDELASKLHVSTKCLTRRFKIATERSVHEYQMSLKLNMAYKLFQENPKRPIKDIAHNMGFYDEFHFSRHFKRKFGDSPRMLKKTFETENQ
jgi:AraC-like DNA-binding protein